MTPMIEALGLFIRQSTGWTVHRLLYFENWCVSCDSLVMEQNKGRKSCRRRSHVLSLCQFFRGRLA